MGLGRNDLEKRVFYGGLPTAFYLYFPGVQPVGEFSGRIRDFYDFYSLLLKRILHLDRRSRLADKSCQRQSKDGLRD